MEKEMRAVALASTDPQGNKDIPNVTQAKKVFKRIRFGKEVYDREYVVWAIRSEFPKFDNTLLSKALRPEEYGIKLLPKAVEAVTGKKDSHRYSKRLSARVSDAAYEVLTSHIAAAGFPSVQAWLNHLIIQYMREEKLIDL